MAEFCLVALAEETTESKGATLLNKWFSITKIAFIWRAFKFKRGHGPPIYSAYADLNMTAAVGI